MPALLVGVDSVVDVIDRLASCVDERVVAWSPSMAASSRDQLVSALVDGDDAISGVDVTIRNSWFSVPTATVEWTMTGRFAHPAFLDDDLLVEASGGVVESGGVTVLSFVGPRVGSIRCYYDRLALLEQALGNCGPTPG